MKTYRKEDRKTRTQKDRMTKTQEMKNTGRHGDRKRKEDKKRGR